MEKVTLGIHFGALCPPIAEQAKESGVSLAEPERLQGYADSITNLYFADILSQSEVDKARKRLMKLIAKSAKKK
jgi:hypothetical protein